MGISAEDQQTGTLTAQPPQLQPLSTTAGTGNQEKTRHAHRKTGPNIG
jgi:hypothetical protein